MKRFISVIIKPTLSCNIACRHCYDGSDERSSDVISADILDRLFKMLSEEYESVWFIWHGGEPLMLPMSFYKNAISLQEIYFGKDSHRVGNTIQTNGINLNRRFMEYCREKMINIGISNEGPFNDVLRQETSAVEKNIKILKDRDHKFSINSTLSSETAGKQLEIYKYFRDQGITVSFSPVIPAGCASMQKNLIPDPEIYVKSSVETFDKWMFDKDSEVPLIPHYLYFLNALGEQVDSDCAHTSCLTKWIAVYPNGDMYPCAKKCPEEYRLCNISDISRISDAFLTEGFEKILLNSIARREKCKECRIFDHCNGGCTVDAYYECGAENNGGASCRMYREIFGHVQEAAERILTEKPDLSEYNRFIRDAVVGKLINPNIINQ